METLTLARVFCGVSLMFVGADAPTTQPGGSAKPQAAATQPAKKEKERKGPFLDNVKVETRDGFMFVYSDGIPDHPTGEFPNRTNPNHIEKQDYVFKIPVEPKKAEKIGKL